MAAIAGVATWLGGYVFAAFVVLAAAGVLWEWVKLSRAFAHGAPARIAWFAGGLIYVGTAAEVLLNLDIFNVLLIILCVIAIDIGAYFAGRSIGGARIAPLISPSKTWAGLLGGMVAAALVFTLGVDWAGRQIATRSGPIIPALHDPVALFRLALVGAVIAIVAQGGDFFESWMKRRAGVKDSGRLIPGHGGLFDRVDGLLAVLFVIGIAMGMASLL